MDKTDARFEFFRSRSDDNLYFRLKATNGQILLGSKGYTTKAACKNGIESVIKNSQRKIAFRRKESTNNKYYFDLYAANQHQIATSQLYESKQGLENCIASVVKNATVAEIIDLTE